MTLVTINNVIISITANKKVVQAYIHYISGQDQKWWPAAAGIAAYGSNHAGFTVWLKVIFLLNIVR
ncbi:hypothetical protein MZT91_22790 [Escherichia coli]|nr:hypothetical protein [Escherichia coli]EID8469620.1 hypothetical protein [Escherichia coli]MBW0077793.1 hypothetical protein [Escherichia coli]HDT1894813.1 hypothetical protein [Escherichia coli]